MEKPDADKFPETLLGLEINVDNDGFFHLKVPAASSPVFLRKNGRIILIHVFSIALACLGLGIYLFLIPLIIVSILLFMILSLFYLWQALSNVGIKDRDTVLFGNQISSLDTDSSGIIIDREAGRMGRFNKTYPWQECSDIRLEWRQKRYQLADHEIYDYKIYTFLDLSDKRKIFLFLLDGKTNRTSEQDTASKIRPETEALFNRLSLHIKQMKRMNISEPIEKQAYDQPVETVSDSEVIVRPRRRK